MPPTQMLPIPIEAPARRLAGTWALVLGLVLAGPVARAAPDAPYPFEGTWIRADRVCTAKSTRVRTYTAKDVTSSRGRCSIRRVASGSGAFELLEDCRHNDRPATITETIRLSSPDAMTLRRQLSRLKIPRSIHYVRCSAASPPRPPH